MQREPLESSTIYAAGYDPAATVLEIEFRNHRLYRYVDVPPAIYKGLRQATSAGAYFSAHIRNDYECWRQVNTARAKHPRPAVTG